MKILVVEDEGVIQLAIASTLRERGHHVVAVNNGDEALRQLDQPFDAVTLDLVLPRKNGLQFLTEALAQDKLHCPVIVVTAYSPEWTEGIAGVTNVVHKPVDPQDLADVVEQAVKGWREVDP